MIDLLNNNFTGNLISFIRKRDKAWFCLAEVEYWIGEWWSGYVNLDNGPLEDLYFEYLKKFRLDYTELVNAYSKLVELGDEFKLSGNKPSLYIDFDKKYFVSNFYEQALEKRLPKNWVGEFDKIDNLIPVEFRYWLQ